MQIHYILLSLLLSLSFGVSSRVIIENATLIDAETPKRIDMTLVLQEDEIVYIGKTNSKKISFQDDDTVIDATGKFIIPGLWDAHVHLTFIPELDYQTAYKLFLKNGITSIRDPGAVIEKLRPAIEFAEDNPSKAPRLFYSGPLIDGIPRVYKGSEPGFPELSIGVNKDTDKNLLVDNLMQEGVSFLKTYEMLTPEDFKELQEIAEERNLRVTSHIPLSMDLIDAVDAGLDGMQHIRNLELACAEEAGEMLIKRKQLLQNEDLLPGSSLRSKIHGLQRPKALMNINQQRCDEVIKYLASNNVYQTPTLTINTVGSKRFFANKEWQETYNFLPGDVKKEWLQNSINLAKQPIDESYKNFEKWSFNIVNLFNKHEVNIIAGTDTPIGFLTPGFSLHKELQLLVEAGLTPIDALKAATIIPAKFFNLEKEIGTIDVGKKADLLILNSNPLINIGNTADIQTVITKGLVYSE
ncbi:MAG: amidohydrolase family protein [Pseudomonadota bacterium]|nr:amidohydrolase family protein [Pseudomonadota bacterium]